jgi:hypothetical protein
LQQSVKWNCCCSNVDWRIVVTMATTTKMNRWGRGGDGNEGGGGNGKTKKKGKKKGRRRDNSLTST